MKVISKNILLISPEPWDHIFVSKHHYAIHLSKRGNSVFFLNPPTRTKISIQSTQYSNLKQINYSGFIPGLRFLPKIIKRTIIKRMIEKFEKFCAVQFDIIWSFDNSVFYDLSNLPQAVIKISHIVDLNMDFNVRVAAKTSSICFCTTSRIKKRLGKYNNNTFMINHGLSLPEKDVAVTILPGENRLKAVYVGNLLMKYLDWKILLQAAIKMSDVDFIFFGPGASSFDESSFDQDKKKIHDLHNVYFPGRISSDKIPAVLRASDVLLIAYKENHHSDQANPHKVMEYLYSGKPIVATYTEEYAEKDLLQMTYRNHEWSGLLREVVSNLDKYNARDLADRRIAFALDNTYDQQIDRIEILLKK